MLGWAYEAICNPGAVPHSLSAVSLTYQFKSSKNSSLHPYWNLLAKLIARLTHSYTVRALADAWVKTAVQRTLVIVIYHLST